MTPQIQLILGFFVISVALSYAAWSRLRVWVFRQSLFEIRDALWDKMHARGKLNDQEYIHAREWINALIRRAEWCTPAGLISMGLFDSNDDENQKPIAPPLDPDIVAAIQKSVKTLLNHMLARHLSGWFFIFFIFIIVGPARMLKSVSKVANKVVQADELDSTFHKPHLN